MSSDEPLSDEQMYKRMAKGWRMGRPFTVCGNGSLPEATVNIRKWLPGLCKRFDIRSICDAGAGDMQWMHGMEWDVDYWPFDLIPRHSRVWPLDITRDPLPHCDAVLCRMVLNHLDRPRVEKALALFRQSAPYLIATQFAGQDLPQRTREFCRLDLRESLGEPLELVQDGLEEYCTLALWRL